MTAATQLPSIADDGRILNVSTGLTRLANPLYRDMLLPKIAMGRIGEPDDVGRAIAAVLDERMAWVTGQRIEASGGQRL